MWVQLPYYEYVVVSRITHEIVGLKTRAKKLQIIAFTKTFVLYQIKMKWLTFCIGRFIARYQNYEAYGTKGSYM